MVVAAGGVSRATITHGRHRHRLLPRGGVEATETAEAALG